MNYKKGLKIVRETTLTTGGTFGTAPGIGQQGGNVGNSDFYAPGNSMNLYGGISDPDRPYGSKKHLKSKSKRDKARKEGKFPLYKRHFIESLVAEEVNDEELVLDCVIRFADSNSADVLKKILEQHHVTYDQHYSDLLSFQGFDSEIRNVVEKLQSIVDEDSMLVMIGEMDQVTGGKSDNKTPEDVAKKHGISIDYINKQLAMGIEIESEHTTDKKVAREIALDHLWEFANYYTELKKMEERLKVQNGKRKQE